MAPQEEPTQMTAVSADLLTELGLDPNDVEVQHGLEDAEAVARLVCTLVEARKRCGLSQKQVAERMGTTQSAVSDLERTAGDPRLSTLQRFGRAVGLKLRVVAVQEGPRYVASVVIPINRTTSDRRQGQVHWRGHTEPVAKVS
jgi:ribosome-binding protein aMBF1 (putative translation factor)